MKRGYRTERDYLGSRKVPIKAYYGIQTQRALENFKVSGLHMQKSLISALAITKKAAAISNVIDKKLDLKIGEAIIKACTEIIEGKFDAEFHLDVFQAGAGTSENMNLNEVIANRALEILKHKKGSYHIINPNDHVNMSQSTNDVFHTAIHIAAYLEIKNQLIPALKNLEKEFQFKSRQFKAVLKSGRTHLMDAVPMTLGQEFSGYAAAITKDREHLEQASQQLLEINIGGTAVGTGLNTTAKYRKNVILEINRLTKSPFVQSKNLFEATQNLDAIIYTSGALKVLAANLIKISNDFRLLASGPATGLGEIRLPAVQPGSSIMPGKVNPSIAEMMDMVGFQVIGNDTTLTFCAQAGQLELNVMMPLAAYSLLNSIEILSNGIETFTERCVKGIKANEKKARMYLERNPIIITALAPYLGYEKAAEVAKKSYKEGKTVKEIILKEKLMDKKTLDKLLSVKKLLR